MGNGGSIIGGIGGRTSTTTARTTTRSTTTAARTSTTTSLIRTTTSLLLTTTTSLNPTSSSALTSSRTTLSTTEPLPVVTTAASSTASVLPTSQGSAVASSIPTGTPGGANPVQGATVDSTILVFVRTADDQYTATSGLDGHGIPFQAVIVPQAGITLPQLNSSATAGNYGGIIVMGELSYNYGTAGADNWSSAFSPAQWNEIYAYQVNFGVRLARLDAYPGPNSDTTVVGGCCGTGVEQLLSFTDVSDFPTSGLQINAGVTTQGLYHYPSTITNTTRTKRIAAFGPSSDGTYPGLTTAAVINNFDGRQQMVWFTSMATFWAMQTNWIQHSWIHWLTRGTFAGRRRLLFNTQIDDVHLSSPIYYPAGRADFRTRPGDYAAHVAWTKDINSRMPPGSNYIIELGHNGNGDIENATAKAAGQTLCKPNESILYPEQIDTALEFQKPLGTGDNIWPATPATYSWSIECAKLDELATWFTNPTNRDAFAHVSHTFSHMGLNNATTSDAAKEIDFNVAWLKQTGIYDAKIFSPNGIIPPAITGLHNGDVIKVWVDRGIINLMGDNTRPTLMARQNEFWPVHSTVAANGYEGITIIPRWATTIFYNCDTLECTHQEWVVTSGGKGTTADLINDARATNVRHLLGLHHDPFMFHQNNLRQIDMPTITVGPVTGTLSLLQHWTEVVVQEMTRLTNWPFITAKHDQVGVEFRNRETRDKCNYKLKYNQGSQGKTITSVTVTANGNTCGAPIPVTVPGDTSSVTGGSSTRDKVGNEPLIVWVTLAGSPVTINLASPVNL